jgi:hypothetical protein
MAVGVTNHKSFVSQLAIRFGNHPRRYKFRVRRKEFSRCASAESYDFSLVVHQIIRVVIWRGRALDWCNRPWGTPPGTYFGGI